jgi:hypothetical protein
MAMGGATSTIAVVAPLQNVGTQIQLNLLPAGGLQNVTAMLSVKLLASSGLQLAAGGMSIDLDTTPGLALAAGGVKVLLDPTTPGLQLTSGVKVLLDPTTPGLQLTSGVKIKLDTTPALALAAGGLSVLLDPTKPGLQRTSGLKILVDPTNPGLQLTSGLKVLLSDTSLVLGAGGLGVNLAATPGLEISSGLKVKSADTCLTLAAGGLGISNFVGDAGAGGVKGAVPAPAAGDATKFLKGNATWATVVPAAGSILYSMLSLAANPGLEDGGASATQVKVAAPITRGASGVGVSDFTGDAGAGGTRGTVPAPAAGDTALNRFLKANATWGRPAYTHFEGVTAMADLTNTVTETYITEYDTFAANTLEVGRRYVLRFPFLTKATAGLNYLWFRFYVGGTLIVATFGTVTVDTNWRAGSFQVEFVVTAVAGSASQGNITVLNDGSYPVMGRGGANINLAASNTMKVSAQWNDADAGNHLLIYPSYLQVA